MASSISAAVGAPVGATVAATVALAPPAASAGSGVGVLVICQNATASTAPARSAPAATRPRRERAPWFPAAELLAKSALGPVYEVLPEPMMSTLPSESELRSPDPPELELWVT